MKIEGHPRLECEITIRLNEAEARALLQFPGYGTDNFPMVVFLAACAAMGIEVSNG